jgi:purine-nucleoside phosphorylase
MHLCNTKIDSSSHCLYQVYSHLTQTHRQYHFIIMPPKGDETQFPIGEPIMKRGYSMLQLRNEARVSGVSIHSNVLIKKNLPARGIVSSNPLRVDSLLQRCTKEGIFTNVTKHTDSGWGVRIWTCEFGDVELFVAVVPMGSTGAGFCFWEMYAAQAQAILRLGANDVTATRNEVVVCHKADNLVNLPHAAGDLEVTRQTVFDASPALVSLLTKHFPGAETLIVHNVEDYHAYNFSECLPDGGAHITEFIDKLKSRGECCWDMESAALFYRAKQFGLHAATALVPMRADEIEVAHYRRLFQALVEFTPSVAVPLREFKPFGRDSRKFSTNDLIGVEEPLYINDPEVGNNLFMDESEVGDGGDEGGMAF